RTAERAAATGPSSPPGPAPAGPPLPHPFGSSPARPWPRQWHLCRVFWRWSFWPPPFWPPAWWPMPFWPRWAAPARGPAGSRLPRSSPRLRPQPREKRSILITCASRPALGLLLSLPAAQSNANRRLSQLKQGANMASLTGEWPGTAEKHTLRASLAGVDDSVVRSAIFRCTRETRGYQD